MRNFYTVLGIATTADDQRIKTAFRRRVKAVHPDLNPGNQRAKARFIELMQAYEVLSDAESRVAYDTYLADRRRESRRRLLHCAGLMLTSFTLTASSAVLLMGIAGANVPFREGWRETWRTAVTVVTPGKVTSGPAEDGQDGWGAQVAVAATEAPPMPPPDHAKGAPRPKSGIRAVGALSKAEVAAASKQAPLAVTHPEPSPSAVPGEGWSPFAPTDDDQPRYGLGASDLKR